MKNNHHKPSIAVLVLPLNHAAAISAKTILAALLLLSAFPCLLFAQKPVITYPAPPDYYVIGYPVSVTPTSTGVAAPHYGIPASIGITAPGATSIGIDYNGSVVVARQSQHKINAYPLVPYFPREQWTFNSPAGIALYNGYLYIADPTLTTIKRLEEGYDGASTTAVNIGSGFGQPSGVAVDGYGNVYVCDQSKNNIVKVPAGGGPQVVIGTGFNAPKGIAADRIGNVYVADSGNGVIKMIPAGGGTPVILASGFLSPVGIAIDGSGNLFVGDTGNNQVKEIPAGGGSPILIGSGLTGSAIAVDTDNKLFVADLSTDTIKKIVPIGGYYINVTLPDGLTFNCTTGVISGTPTKVTPKIFYFVTAYNSSGESYPPGYLNFGISEDTRLSNLTISKGTLSPAFVPDRTSYTDQVSNATTSVLIRPTARDANATIKVNGVPVSSGTVTGNISLAIGSNVIPIVVTSADGATSYTINLTVYRAGPTIATLSNLAVSAGTLSPAFASGTTTYTDTVSNTTDPLGLTYATTDPNASVKVSSNTSISRTGQVYLSVGITTINIVVTAQDDLTTKTYTINVYRRPSTVTILDDLLISRGKLSPVFASGTTTYTDTVVSYDNSIIVEPIGNYAFNQNIKVNGVMAGKFPHYTEKVPLNIGLNTITILVTAEDGIATKTYTLTVKRLSQNADLVNLTLNGGTFSPAFNEDMSSSVGSYTSTVSNATSSVTVTPIALNPAAYITINGVRVASGTASPAIPLNIGTNTITTVILGPDGTQKHYTIIVNRLSNDAGLSALSISTGALSPEFKEYRHSYTSGVTTDVSVKVRATMVNTHARLRINGVPTASGGLSGNIPLNIGSNTITIVTTSPDNTTQKTYTVAITRSASGLNSFYLPGNYGEAPFVSSLGAVVEANNILSPNGDGVNDIWVVKNIAFYPNNTVTVYDKAGELVFTKKGYANDWDGAYRGSVLSEGTYYYLVDLGNGEKVKGFFTVVKH